MCSIHGEGRRVWRQGAGTHLSRLCCFLSDLHEGHTTLQRLYSVLQNDHREKKVEILLRETRNNPVGTSLSMMLKHVVVRTFSDGRSSLPVTRYREWSTVGFEAVILARPARGAS